LQFVKDELTSWPSWFTATFTKGAFETANWKSYDDQFPKGSVIRAKHVILFADPKVFPTKYTPRTGRLGGVEVAIMEKMEASSRTFRTARMSDDRI